MKETDPDLCAQYYDAMSNRPFDVWVIVLAKFVGHFVQTSFELRFLYFYIKERWGQKMIQHFLNELICICKPNPLFLSFKKKIISNKTADHFDFNFNFLTSSEKLNL